jgi:2-dehydropantoate 2-reductase
MLQLHSDGRALAHELADEALRVAQAEGVGVSADKVHGLVDYACEHHTWHRPSMLSDLENGKPTEIDAINGYIVAAAARHGIDTPHNSLLLRLVKLRESGPEFWAGEPTGGY